MTGGTVRKSISEAVTGVDEEDNKVIAAIRPVYASGKAPDALIADIKKNLSGAQVEGFSLKALKKIPSDEMRFWGAITQDNRSFIPAFLDAYNDPEKFNVFDIKVGTRQYYFIAGAEYPALIGLKDAAMTAKKIESALSDYLRNLEQEAAGSAEKKQLLNKVYRVLFYIIHHEDRMILDSTDEPKMIKPNLIFFIPKSIISGDFDRILADLEKEPKWREVVFAIKEAIQKNAVVHGTKSMAIPEAKFVKAERANFAMRTEQAAVAHISQKDLLAMKDGEKKEDVC
jgi:hypothetical protein